MKIKNEEVKLSLFADDMIFFLRNKFMSKASLTYVPNDHIQAANKEFFNFIWEGKDKVKRFALINDIEYGGLKIMDLESMIRAQRIMCLKKYIDDYTSAWKSFLSYSCLLYTSPSPRDQRGSRMPSSA